MNAGEKHKNPERGGWLYSRWFAGYFGFILFVNSIPALLELTTPLTGTFVDPQTLNFSYVFAGIPFTFVIVVGFTLLGPTPQVSQIRMVPLVQEQAGALFVWLCLCLLLVAALCWLQRYRRLFKVVIVLNFLPYALLLIYSVVTGHHPVLAPPPAQVIRTEVACDYAVSDTIRIHAVSQYTSFTTIKTRLDLSVDNGRTWRTFMTAYMRCENKLAPERPVIKTAYLDDRTFWLWTTTWLVVTHDGGETWHRKEFSMDTPTLWDVRFDDDRNGQMIIGKFRYDSQHASMTLEDGQLLKTTDGGITWEPE